LHAALARVLESSDPPASLLAHHWDEAGEVEPALHWHRKAADELGFVALDEMLRHWRRVSGLLDRLPETPENLATAATARAQILWIGLRSRITPEEVEELYSEALLLAERAGDRATLSGAHRAYATHRLLSGQTGAAKLAEVAVREADQAGDRSMQVTSRYGAAWIHAFAGTNLRLGLQRADEAIDLVGDDLDLGADLLGFSPRLMLQSTRSHILSQMGRLKEAKPGIESVRVYSAETHPVPVIATGCYAVYAAERGGDSAWAMAEAKRLAVELERQSIATVTIAGHHYIGVAQALNERWDDALASLEDSLAHARAGQTMLNLLPENLGWRARAYMGKGAPDRARELLEEAIDRARKQELGVPLATLLLADARLRITLESGTPESMESEIDEAAAIIERDECRGFEPDVHELRAALLRLRGDEPGRRRELERARELACAMGAPMRADRIAALLA
jgi:adenylate cyclase